MTTLDRIYESLRALIRAETPTLTFLGVWEYSVSSATATSFSGRPTSSHFPLPDLVDVPLRVGVAGASFRPAVGSLVLVAFANADPRRPVVLNYDATAPADLELDSTGAVVVGASASSVALGPALGRVLREGDTLTLTGVQSGAGATGVVATVTIGLGVPPLPSPVRA